MWRPGEAERQPQKARGASERPLGHSGGPGAPRRAGIGAVGRAACTLGRPACRTVGLGLPNSPARSREGEAPTSHHQVRLFAQAQTYGAETRGRTANRGSGGAGKGSSPRLPSQVSSSLGFPGVGQAGGGRGGRKWVVVTRKGYPALACIVVFQPLLLLRLRETIAEGWCAKNVSSGVPSAGEGR